MQNGHEVRVLDDLSNSTKKYLQKSVDFIQGSILEEKALLKAIKNIEGIFHLAAMVSVPDSIVHWHQNHLINCASTIRILEMAQGIPFIFASSAAVYGDIKELPHQENMVPQPLSPYAVDKLSCEMHARLAWQLQRTPSICFRFFNVYGPRQNPNSPYSGVISRFTDQLSRHETLTIYGDGEQRRDFIFVRDVARILLESMKHVCVGSHVFNLCTGKDISINELAALLGRLMDISVKKKYVPPRHGDILFSVGDPCKAASELGLKAEVPLVEGLTQVLKEISLGGILR
jgi:UDP-glucose 4-epimerase